MEKKEINLILEKIDIAKYDKVNYEMLFARSGDPFVDAGGYVLECLLEMEKDYIGKDLIYIIERVVTIYVNVFGKDIRQFFHNSRMTQSGDKIQNAIKYYRSIIEESSDEACKKGVCRILGYETKVFEADRRNCILSGAGTLRNFNHDFENGFYISKEAIIRMLFVPLACKMISGIPCFAISNTELVMKEIVKQNVNDNIKRANYLSKSPYRYASNTLFSYVEDVVTKIRAFRDGSIPLSLTLFHFSNCGQNCKMRIYNLPYKIASFYLMCLHKYKEDWMRFINAQYYNYQSQELPYDTINETYSDTIEETLLIDKEKWETFGQKESVEKELILYGIAKNSNNDDCYIFDNKEYKKIELDKSLKQEIKKISTIEKNARKVNCNGDVYKYNWNNRVYERLMNGQSLLSLFQSWTDPTSYCQNFNFDIVKLYCKHILNMNEQTLELIERLSTFIVNNHEHDLTKVITQLKICKSPEFRSLLIKEIERNYRNGNEEPLLRMRDYVMYLTPSGSNIYEIKDLILICIYQILHEKRMNVEIEEDVENNNQD